jgi:hypothetical protein
MIDKREREREKVKIYLETMKSLNKNMLEYEKLLPLLKNDINILIENGVTNHFNRVLLFQCLDLIDKLYSLLQNLFYNLVKRR